MSNILETIKLSSIRIRYGDNNYREMNEPKWKWVKDKDGKTVSTFSNREKARQFIRNHLRYRYDRTEIVEA